MYRGQGQLRTGVSALDNTHRYCTLVHRLNHTVITQPVGHPIDVGPRISSEWVLPKLAWCIMFVTFIATYL
jgi:hypothetical protein